MKIQYKATGLKEIEVQIPSFRIYASDIFFKIYSEDMCIRVQTFGFSHGISFERVDHQLGVLAETKEITEYEFDEVFESELQKLNSTKIEAY